MLKPTKRLHTCLFESAASLVVVRGSGHARVRAHRKDLRTFRATSPQPRPAAPACSCCSGPPEAVGRSCALHSSRAPRVHSLLLLLRPARQVLHTSLFESGTSTALSRCSDKPGRSSALQSSRPCRAAPQSARQRPQEAPAHFWMRECQASAAYMPREV